jgi:hypothetical protein
MPRAHSHTYAGPKCERSLPSKADLNVQHANCPTIPEEKPAPPASRDRDVPTRTGLESIGRTIRGGHDQQQQRAQEVTYLRNKMFSINATKAFFHRHWGNDSVTWNEYKIEGGASGAEDDDDELRVQARGSNCQNKYSITKALLSNTQINQRSSKERSKPAIHMKQKLAILVGRRLVDVNNEHRTR